MFENYSLTQISSLMISNNSLQTFIVTAYPVSYYIWGISLV